MGRLVLPFLGLLGFLGLPASPAGAAAPAEPPPELAITIDDLPVHGPLPPGETPVDVARRMAEALRAAGVTTAFAFVNGRWTETDPATREALEIWRRAGVPLGNHSWSHASVEALDPAAYEQEIARNEPLLRQLMGDRDWHWFRYPYLAEGENPARRAAVRAILARRGYRIADVTMDFSDWLWTAPYARCRSQGDEAAIGELERLYLALARKSAAYYRWLARAAYGRDIPYVLLLHTGAFDARMLKRLVDQYREDGFRLVTLDQAERDPAYREARDPSLPATLQGLEARARAKGAPVPDRTDFASRLAEICVPPNPADGEGDQPKGGGGVTSRDPAH